MLLDAIVLAGGRSSRLGGSPKAELLVEGRRLVDIAVEAALAAGCRHVVVVGPDALAPLPTAVALTRENPPFGGPAAALAAGLTALETLAPHSDHTTRSDYTTRSDHTARSDHITRSDRTARSDHTAHSGLAEPPIAPDALLVLACDMPGAASALPALLDAARTASRASGIGAGADVGWAAMAVDHDGRRQPLLAVYGLAGLRARVAARSGELGGLEGAPFHSLLDGLGITEVPVPAGSSSDIDTWADAGRFHAHPNPVGAP